MALLRGNGGKTFHIAMPESNGIAQLYDDTSNLDFVVVAGTKATIYRLKSKFGKIGYVTKEYLYPEFDKKWERYPVKDSRKLLEDFLLNKREYVIIPYANIMFLLRPAEYPHNSAGYVKANIIEKIDQE